MKRTLLLLLLTHSISLTAKPVLFRHLKKIRQTGTTENNTFNQSKAAKYLASRKTKETRFNETLRILCFDLKKNSEIKHTQKDIAWVQKQAIWFTIKNPDITKNIPKRLRSTFEAIKKYFQESLIPSQKVSGYKKLFTDTTLDRTKLENFITLRLLNGKSEESILSTLYDLRKQCREHLDKSDLELLENKEIALLQMQQEKWMHEELIAASQNTQSHHLSDEFQ